MIWWKDMITRSLDDKSILHVLTPGSYTGPLKPKVASKNPWMKDYIQKKDFDKDFRLVYVATIFFEGNIN